MQVLADPDGEPLDDLALVLLFTLARRLPRGERGVVGGAERLEVRRVDAGLLERRPTAGQPFPLLGTGRLDRRAQRQLDVLPGLADAGVPVGVLVAPVIPQLNDRDLEAILEAAAAHGATSAGWILLRLPLEVAPLFRAWLDEHYPLRAAHVMSLVQQLRGGRDNDPNFGSRMRGAGTFAELIARRFALATKRLGLNDHRTAPLDVTRFRPPRANEAQRELF